MSTLSIARARLATSVVEAHVSCSHEEMGTYVDRFGSTNCSACHAELSWNPANVREGLYGDHTDAWIEAQTSMREYDEDYPPAP